MNKEYFKNLNTYNTSEKLDNSDMLLRLNKRIKDINPDIVLNKVVNYVMCDSKYITLYEKTLDVFGETTVVKVIESISL